MAFVQLFWSVGYGLQLSPQHRMIVCSLYILSNESDFDHGVETVDKVITKLNNSHFLKQLLHTNFSGELYLVTAIRYVTVTCRVVCNSK